LKALVDLGHVYGLAVIGDVVYNHGGGPFDDQSMRFFDRPWNREWWDRDSYFIAGDGLAAEDKELPTWRSSMCKIRSAIQSGLRSIWSACRPYHSDLDDHVDRCQCFEMPVETARDRATLDENACFHVPLHRMPCQIGAANEAEILVGHGDLRVNASSREFAFLVYPREYPSRR
jgi:hypothetical protein